MASQFKAVNGRFKFTPPPSEARSKRSEVVRTYREGSRLPRTPPFVSAFGDTALYNQRTPRLRYLMNVRRDGVI